MKLVTYVQAGAPRQLVRRSALCGRAPERQERYAQYSAREEYNAACDEQPAPPGDAFL